MNGRYDPSEWNDSTDVTQTITGWGLGVNPDGSIKPNPQRMSFIDVDGVGKTFGGPCAWCRPGQGAWVPKATPAPWTPATVKATDDGGQSKVEASSPSFNIVSKAQELGVFPYEMNPKLCGETIGCASALTSRVPVARQPNGGWQLLLREAGTNKCWVYYFDDRMNYFDRFFLEATDIGGIVAFDDGTAIAVSQVDCDAPPTTNSAGGNMNRAVVLCWRGGSLKWTKRLTDPYRKQAGSISIDDYVDDPTGNGQFVTNMYFSRMKGNADKNQIGVCVQQSGGTLDAGGNHWGSVLYSLDADSGKVVEQHFACSHDIGGRICPTASGFAQVCAEDGVGKPPVRGLSVTCGGTKGCPAFTDSDQYNAHLSGNSVDEAGWAASRIRSLIPRNDNAGGFVLAYLSKKNKKFNDIVVRLFDANMRDQTGAAPIVILKNDTSYEYFNLHLMPFGAGTGTYLMYYETLKDPVCNSGVNAGTLESRCYGPVLGRKWQLVKQQKDGSSFEISEVTTVDGVRMNDEDPGGVRERRHRVGHLQAERRRLLRGETRLNHSVMALPSAST